ncbi:polymorphic toxin type 15 domain-containing protein [Methylobacterium aquaticum]|uniref:polymorphic toxin type 15 domain-containing protein n=1 Tax=Methylobacterium aquaticum TaxID=270351 RepID=UPI0009E7E7A8|nr:polymorphic toxin type 15 domain-containing protein [Methylobacterium aquaticum]
MSRRNTVGEAVYVKDQVLGGHLSEILRMGSAKINSVIGGGWPSRLKEFERHAKNLKPDEKMKIELCATIKGQDACRGK